MEDQYSKEYLEFIKFHNERLKKQGKPPLTLTRTQMGFVEFLLQNKEEIKIGDLHTPLTLVRIYVREE
jgi:hypothetical protein